MHNSRGDISAFEADEMARRAYHQGWKDGNYTALDTAISALWSTDYKFVPNTDALCDGDALIFIRDAVTAIEALRSVNSEIDMA